MSEELKPVRCGCGGEAEVDCYLGCISTHNLYYVYCKNCYIQSANYKTEAEAVEAWNRAMGGYQFREVTKKIERKKGKWIYDGKRGRFPACKCSICGHYENADWAILQGANFCPHCGADMRGER